MSGLASVIEQALLAAVAGEQPLLSRASRTGWAVTALSVLLAGGGVFFLVLALDRYLEGLYPPYIAALASAAALLAAALVALAVKRFGRACRPPAPAPSAQEALASNLVSLIEDAMAELEGPIQSSPKTALLLAAVIGFFLANQTKNR